MKKKSVVTNADFAENSSLSDIEYYKTKNVPATGYYLKDEDDELKAFHMKYVN